MRLGNAWGGLSINYATRDFDDAHLYHDDYIHYKIVMSSITKNAPRSSQIIHKNFLYLVNLSLKSGSTMRNVFFIFRGYN